MGTGVAFFGLKLSSVIDSLCTFDNAILYKSLSNNMAENLCIFNFNDILYCYNDPNFNKRYCDYSGKCFEIKTFGSNACTSPLENDENTQQYADSQYIVLKHLNNHAPVLYCGHNKSSIGIDKVCKFKENYDADYGDDINKFCEAYGLTVESEIQIVTWIYG